jgi:nucleotide-binding universal stress UspA family protein
METILCATDLTESSKYVVASAGSLAKALHAKVELLHALTPALALTPETFPGIVVEQQRAAAEAGLAQQATALRSLDVEVGASVVVGYPDELVTATAKRLGASLVVLGNHARGAVGRAFLGSTAERTVRKAPCPILVVPPGGGGLADWSSGVRPLRLTTAIDLSPASDAALGVVRRLRDRVRCETRFVHLYWPPREHERLGLPDPDSWQASPEVVDVLARELSEHLARELGKDAGPLRVRPSWGAEENPLAWEAETDDADVLVVGTSQERHSTAIDVLRGSTLPVLVVPARLAGKHDAPLAPVRHVLAATDFSPLGNAAVAEAYRVALRGGVVTLVHVAKVETEDDRLHPDAKTEIENCLLALVPPGVNPHTVATRVLAVAGPSAATSLVQAIHRVGPDLVVLASHGRSGVARAVRGSVAEEVLRQSPKPVLIVPRAAEPPGREGLSVR